MASFSNISYNNSTKIPSSNQNNNNNKYANDNSIHYDEMALISELPDDEEEEQDQEIFGYNVKLLYSLLQTIWQYVNSRKKCVNIDWIYVSENVKCEPYPSLSPIECQNLWRFVAYDMNLCGESISGRTNIDTSILYDDLSDLDLPPTSPPPEVVMETAKTSSGTEQDDLDNYFMDEKESTRVRKKPRKKKIWSEEEDIKLLQTFMNCQEGDGWFQINEKSKLNADIRQIKSRTKTLKKIVENNSISDKSYLSPYIYLLQNINLRDIGKVPNNRPIITHESLDDNEIENEIDIENEMDIELNQDINREIDQDIDRDSQNQNQSTPQNSLIPIISSPNLISTKTNTDQYIENNNQNQNITNSNGNKEKVVIPYLEEYLNFE